MSRRWSCKVAEVIRSRHPRHAQRIVAALPIVLTLMLPAGST
jgi:hypothetical protein